MSDTTREDFEKWFDKQRPLLQPTADARRVEAGYYGSCGLAWETWQAAWTASRQKALQEAIAQVPTTWLDELLTARPPYSGPDVESLLNGVVQRLRSLGGITSNEGDKERG